MRTSLLLVLATIGCTPDPLCDAQSSEPGARVGGVSYRHLQTALDRAADGDTVHVCAGTYEGNLVVEHDVVLESYDGASVTTLDAASTGSAIYVGEGADLTLRGFTVTGGTGEWVTGHGDTEGRFGGGVLAVEAGHVVIADSVLTGNVADGGAGVQSFDSASLQIKDSVLTGNESLGSGGGGDAWGTDVVRLQRVEISENVSAAYTPGFGIVYADEACELRDTVIARNEATTDEGGGALLLQTDCVLIDTVIEQNSLRRSWAGGGLVVADADVLMFHTTIRDNEAKWGAGVGVLALTRDVRIAAYEDSKILYNHAVQTPSAYTSGGGVAVTTFAPGLTVTLDGLVVKGNTSEYGGGGGVHFTSMMGGHLVLDDMIIDGNLALGDGGGGVEAFTTVVDGTEPPVDVTITDSVVQGNDAGGVHPFLGGGGGMLLWDVGNVVIEDTRFADNTSLQGGGVALVAWDTCAMKGVDIRDNAAGGEAGGLLMWGPPDDSFVATGHTCTLTDTEIWANWTEGYGGGFAIAGVELLLEESFVHQNNATVGGAGALWTHNATPTTLHGDGASSLSGNAATMGGGLALLSSEEGVPLVVRDVVIEDNHADRGGAVYAPEFYAGVCAPLGLAYLSLDDNEAVEGGGLYLGCAMAMLGSHVTRNVAEDGGGAFLTGRAALRSIGTDWGVGTLDNEPDDLWTGEQSYPKLGETFTCSANPGLCKE